MIDKSTFEKLIDRASLLLVLLGILLFVIGAAGGWPSPALQVNELGWRIALAAMGVIVAILGGLLLWRERASPPPTSCDVYGIRIVSPRTGDEIAVDFEISGTYTTKPPNARIIQPFIQGPPGTDAYWPIIEANVTLDETKKTWRTPARAGGGPGRRDIVIAVIGQAGDALCKYYHKVGKETGRWVGITALTPDAVECDRVTVMRK